MKTLLLLLLATQANAVIELKTLYVDYKNFAALNENNRNLLLYPESAKEALNLGITTDVLAYFYWDSEIQSLTTAGQYRGVGLDTRLGVRLTNDLEFGYAHKSQHLLDRPSETLPRYPVEDSIQIKFFIFRDRQLSREGIF